MKPITHIAFAAVAAFGVAACTQTATNLPVQQQVDPVASNSLQFAVGVATISAEGTVGTGLNVVETLRQSDGLSGTLYNTPVITGPAGFSISAGSQTITGKNSLPITSLARGDFNTNRISQQTFDMSSATHYNQALPYATTGAFGYGFCPCNSNSAPISGQPQLYHAYYLPFYTVLQYGSGGVFNPNLQYYGGPPAFPSATPELAQAGFNGYPLGFTDFAIAPVAGTYRLDVAIPPDFFGPNSTPTPQPSPSESPVPTLSATAQLKSTAGLPPFPTPQFQSDSSGGGTIVLNIPAGVTESIALIQEGLGSTPYCNSALNSPTFYSFFVKGSGIKTITVPDSIGPAGLATICTQSPYFVYAVGFDYPAFEAAYPQSTSQNPVITNGVNGQADVTTSDAFAGTY